MLVEVWQANRLDLSPLDAFQDFAVTGCAPEEKGIDLVFAVPKFLARYGLKVKDIDLWTLNEAFTSHARIASVNWTSPWSA